MNAPTLPLVAGLLFSAISLPAAEALKHWPQWRGPLANGVAPEAKPPLTWSESSHLKWKFEIPGYGTSTPIIWGDQVFLLTAQPVVPKTAEARPTPPAPQVQGNEPPRQGSGPRPGSGGGPRGGGGGGMRSEAPTEPYRFLVMAVDRKTGRELWRKVAREEIPHEGHHRDHGFASHSPVTDGDGLYVNYGSRGLHAYDLQGNKRWEKDLGRMRTRNGFGEGGAPALHGHILVVNWDHEGEDFVAAFDKKTGKELWRQKRDELTTWTSPLVVEHGGKAQVVVSATQRVRSYDLETGRLLWECGGMTGNVVPTPVAAFGHVYAISGFRGAALLAIKLGQEGDLTDSPAITWKHTKNTPYVPSPLLYGERLYFYSGNNAMLSCFNAKEGKALIDAERMAGINGVYASPLGADGRVYLVGRDGKTMVIKDADTLEVLATNALDDEFDASPAAVGTQLFLRGKKSLYCLEGS